jgi:hypothetical protein
MAKLTGLLIDLALAAGVALALGTWLSASDLAYGYDLRHPLLAAASALIWLAPALTAVWIARWGMSKAGRALGVEWGQEDSRRLLLPLLSGWVCLLQPMIGYAPLGPALLLLALIAIIWRWWTKFRATSTGAKLPEDLEGLPARFGDGRTAAALAGVVFIIYLVVISGLFASLPQPEGDEPHYLIVAYSLLTDGDVELTNNYYDNRDYRLWHEREGSPVGYAHTKKGTDSRREFSMHTAGLPAYLIPFLAAGLLFGNAGAIHFFAHLGLILPATAFIALLFLTLRRLEFSRTLSAGLTLLTALTCPVLFFSYHVFTELPAALLCLFAFYHLWPEKNPGLLPRIFVGLALGALPWLGPKYILLAAPLCLLWLVREIRWGLRWGKVLAVALPGLILGAAFLWHTYSLFGAWNPAAFYVGASGSITEKNPVFKVGHAGDLPAAVVIAGKTALSYWVDQREGLLFYAPWFLLAAAGWIAMAAAKEKRWLAWWLLALILPFYFLYSLTGFNGGHSPPARSLTAMIWALVIPAAWGLKLGLERAREFTFFLITLSLILAGALLMHPDFLYHDFHVPASHILSNLSTPFLDLTRAFPSVNSKHFEVWWVTGLWCLVIIAAIAWLLAPKGPDADRHRFRYAGAAALVMAALAVAWAVSAVTAPLEEKRLTLADSGFELLFEPGGAYIEPQAFWVKSEKTAWCYFVARDPSIELELSLRTVVPNVVLIHFGLRSAEVRLIDVKTETVILEPQWEFQRGGLWVARIGFESTRGVPEGSGFVENESRALGAEVKIQSVKRPARTEPDNSN